MNIQRETWLILAGLAGVLALASVITLVLGLRSGNRPTSDTLENLNSRVKSWWSLVAVGGGALLAGRTAIIGLFALVSFAALREFLTLAPTRPGDRVALFASFFVVLPFQYWLVWRSWYGLFAVFIPVYAFLILPILSAVSLDPKNFLARTAETQWALMITVYCISHVPALLTLDVPGYQGRSALALVFLVVVTQSSDVLQYVWGKLFGRHKMAPEVSPSKTVEGFVGGVASATLLGAGLWQITPFSFWQAAGMALLISLLGSLGGLALSAVKRDLGVKDWGHLIRGHGGMLDRLDSICFSAPIFFHLVRYYFTP